MSAVSVFEYDCEAVRVVARRAAGGSSRSGQAVETRKFSVDPNLTSFDILRTILARAFELQSDFAITYEAPPAPSTGGSGEWLPLLSDWDLDTAIISAAEPVLNLCVAERSFRTLDDLEEQEAVVAMAATAEAVVAAPSAEVRTAATQEAEEAAPRSPQGPPRTRKGSAPVVTAASGATSLRQFSSFRHQV